MRRGADLAASAPLGLMAMPLRTRSRSLGMPCRHACTKRTNQRMEPSTKTLKANARGAADAVRVVGHAVQARLCRRREAHQMIAKSWMSTV